MHKFIVLISKHLIARKRRYFKSFFEFFIPILFILPIYLIQNNIAGSTIEDLSYFESESVSNEYEYQNVHFEKIFYTPNNSVFYRSLMDKVAMKLQSRPSGSLMTCLCELEQFPTIKWNYVVDIIGYLSEDDLMKDNRESMENNRELWAVIFKVC